MKLSDRKYPPGSEKSLMTFQNSASESPSDRLRVGTCDHGAEEITASETTAAKTIPTNARLDIVRILFKCPRRDYNFYSNRMSSSSYSDSSNITTPPCFVSWQIRQPHLKNSSGSKLSVRDSTSAAEGRSR